MDHFPNLISPCKNKISIVAYSLLRLRSVYKIYLTLFLLILGTIYTLNSQVHYGNCGLSWLIGCYLLIKRLLPDMKNHYFDSATIRIHKLNRLQLFRFEFTREIKRYRASRMFRMVNVCQIFCLRSDVNTFGFTFWLCNCPKTSDFKMAASCIMKQCHMISCYF